jgi:hypothetical protein
MKLHPESGQIKVMVADWDMDKIRHVQYHFTIQGTFFYLNNILDVPLEDLDVYDSDVVSHEVDHYYADCNFDDADLHKIGNIVRLMYQTELDEWNDKIINANRAKQIKPNWDMAGSGYLV